MHHHSHKNMGLCVNLDFCLSSQIFTLTRTDIHVKYLRATRREGVHTAYWCNAVNVHGTIGIYMYLHAMVDNGHSLQLEQHCSHCGPVKCSLAVRMHSLTVMTELFISIRMMSLRIISGFFRVRLCFGSPG